MFTAGNRRPWLVTASRAARTLMLVTLSACLFAGSASAATPALDFTAPQSIDSTQSISAVACASSSFCAAVDLDGRFTYTTNPTATSPSWSTPVDVDGTNLLFGISCPSSSICVAVDWNGDAVYLLNPTGTLKTYVQSVDADWQLAAISCPSTGMCVAVDKGGNAEVTTALASCNTTTCAPAWTEETKIDTTQASATSPSALTGIDCPTTTLCVAVDYIGDAMIASNPETTPWKTAASVASGEPLAGVGCDAALACITIDGAGDGEVDDSLTASTPSWSPPQTIVPSGASAISCVAASTALCAVTDDSGDIATTTDPAAATPSWTSQTVDAGQALTAISCPTVGSCVAGDASGDAVIGYGDFLAVLLPGAGTGSVTGTGAGATGNCPSQCDTGYPSSTNVTLTESPAGGSAFTGWSGGGCSGLLSSCEVSVSGLESVSATFEPLEQIGLALSGSGTGSVGATDSLEGPALNCTSACSADYAADTTLDITETPASGSIFTGWSGPCTGTGICHVNVQNAATVTATFTADPTLTVAFAGAGSGVVTGTNIECPGSCSSEFQSGTSETLTATPAPGSTFAGWSGSGCSGTGTCTTTVSSQETVTASFTLASAATVPSGNASSAAAPTDAALAVTVIGSGSVAGIGIGCPDECRDGYPLGTTVTLTATPGPGYVFSGWTGGGCSGTGLCTVTLAQSIGVTATFTATDAKVLPAISVLSVHQKRISFKTRRATVAVRCTGVKACMGKLDLQLRKRNGTTETIATGRFHVRARHREDAKLYLSSAGSALLKAVGRHGEDVTLLASSTAGQRLVVTLRARK
jgi:Divergent InlB B-repeat domain